MFSRTEPEGADINVVTREAGKKVGHRTMKRQ